MKNIKIAFLALLLSPLVFLTSCEDEDKTFFQGDQALRFDGAYLLQLDFPENSISKSDLTGTNFEVTFEAHDYTSDSSLLQDVNVLVTYSENPDVEVALTTIDGAQFTEGEKGYPVYTFISPGSAAVAALGLDPAGLTVGAKMSYRFVLNLTDGSSWTVGDIGTSTVVELNYISPYLWDAAIAL